MDYSFGAAEKSYRDNVRPRVHFSPADLPALRRQLQSGDALTVLREFRRRTREDIRRVLEFSSDDELREAVLEPRTPGRRLIWAGRRTTIANMALLSLLEENEDALSAVRRLFRIIPDADRSDQGRLAISYNAVGMICQAYDMVAPELMPEEREQLCDWAWTMGVQRNLKELSHRIFKAPGQNIPMSGVLNALQALLCLDGEPEAEDAGALWERAIPMLEAMVQGCIGPEGYPEEDMGYGTLMTARVAHTADIIRRAGIYDVYERCPRYRKFGRAILHMTQPWGTHLTTTGDHGDDFGMRTFVLSRLAEENDDPVLIWLLTHLSDSGDISLDESRQVEHSFYSVLMAEEFGRGVPPTDVDPELSFLAPRRGMVSFRSGWQEDATYVAFDGSQRCPAAQGHQHASCGHFMLSAFGDYFAIGPGRYNMEQNCHNVTLIDGESGRTTNGQWHFMFHDGILTDYRPGSMVDVAAVDSSLQHDCFWARRHLGLVRGQHARPYVWIVDDINKNNDWAEYWWQLHTSPENTIEIRGDSATVTGWRSGNQMDVHFVLPDSSEYPRPHELQELYQDIAEPSSYKYVTNIEEHLEKFDRPADQVHYAAFRRPRLIARIGGYNGRFMTLLLPRHADDPEPQVERLDSLPVSLAVRIRFREVEDTLIFAHEHNVLRANGVNGLGHWCLVRRHRETREVLEYELGEGTYLEVDGREVVGNPNEE
jgi:hypothetical protein